MYVTDIAQQVCKKQPIHRVGSATWIGPHKKNAILGALRDRPEILWLSRRDLVWRVGGRPGGVRKRVAGGRADTTSKDLRGLGLLEVEMQRRNLKPLA